MRAVDTNVLVRLATRDDARQTAAAEAFVSKGAWVAHLVLAEAMWVLDSVYALKPAEIAGFRTAGESIRPPAHTCGFPFFSAHE